MDLVFGHIIIKGSFMTCLLNLIKPVNLTEMFFADRIFSIMLLFELLYVSSSPKVPSYISNGILETYSS